MTPGTKKQHFVPQLLLRQFADASERLFVYDMANDRSFRTTVRNAGHQNHFLSVPALDGDRGAGAYFEELFQTFEGPGISAIRDVSGAVSSGILASIGTRQRRDLARFIAIQLARTPAAREQAFQTAELMRRVLATEIVDRNGIDSAHPDVAAEIDKFSTIPKDQENSLHGESILRTDFIEDLAGRLEEHVWLLGVNRTGKSMYVADHPVTVHGHMNRPERGLGPCSYGAEVIIPLSNVLQLSLIERRFVWDDCPELEAKDGHLYSALDEENVAFQQSLQVFSAQQFIYSGADEFDVARRLCDCDPVLRDPLRSRVEALAFGNLVKPRRRSKK
jgi:hypothetical protein